ncbi:MAG: cyclic nucleotide-binding domain-containing protein [Hyphomicrobiales bacterium]|nr:cyclic nucleotide-binding domain-containing protein [Hyphomicrobiales bacterium]
MSTRHVDERLMGLLAGTELLKGVGQDALAACAAQLREVRFEKGQMVFARGEPGTHLYLVTEGQVRLAVATSEGRELSFQIAHAGDVIGEIAVLDGGPRSAEAVALTAVTSYVLERRAFQQLWSEHVEIAAAVISFLCWRIRDASDRLEAIALYPMETRLAKFLLVALAGRTARLSADESQLASYLSEITALMPLYKKQLVTAPRMRGLERERDRLNGEIGMTRSDIERLEQAMQETRLQLEQTRQRQRETVLQQLADVRVRISDLKEKLAIATDVLSRVDVRAPRKGIVQAIKVYAVGAVVKPGEHRRGRAGGRQLDPRRAGLAAQHPGRRRRPVRRGAVRELRQECAAGVRSRRDRLGRHPARRGDTSTLLPRACAYCSRRHRARSRRQADSGHARRRPDRDRRAHHAAVSARPARRPLGQEHARELRRLAHRHPCPGRARFARTGTQLP